MGVNIMKVLVVDDEADLRTLVGYNLKKEGFDVLEASNGRECLEIIESNPDVKLIVLDLMMPEVNGLDVCRILRSRPECQDVSIIMLTARGEESDIVLGLELGADDYLTKPFSNRVLVARVNALARRQTQEDKSEEESFTRGELVVNLLTREISISGVQIKTTFNEFEIIHFLAKNPGWVKSRNQIIKAVHGEDYPVTDRAIDVQIVGLRKKMKESGSLIETVRGIGYRFKEV